MTKEIAIEQLIELYEDQISDLVVMSKIELGDDVIAEIKNLKKIIENKTEEEKEDWAMVSYRMRSEGFDYCWRHYSNFEEIKDGKFHELRKAYIGAANELEKYVMDKEKK
jgi:hypothetical protein